ncbi:MAG: prolyl oligopeptidase family serine peptidase, partial [Deltaproteobacteria bacterium]|nr:prolyl oligopeptidase family serine peptidase [Deltaproteobacteria bacterium]
RQLEDWQAALGYVQELSIVDQDRMALWGSSFAGGHVLSVAGSPWSKLFQLKAVVSQLPFCDSRTAFKHVGAKVALRGVWQGLQGVLLNLFGKNHTVAIVGREKDKDFAVMSHAGWADRYLELAEAAIKDGAKWTNEIPARSLLKAGTYNPIDYASKIECPVLVVYGLKDQGIPAVDVERTADLITQVERFTFDGDHFEAYDKGAFVDEIIEREVRFLKSHLF